MEIANPNRRKKAVLVGLGDNISILSGVWKYGKGQHNDVGVARAPIEIMVFSDPGCIGLTIFIAFLVQKTMTTKNWVNW